MLMRGARAQGARKIDFAAFERALPLLAEHKGLALGEVRCAMVLSEGPRRNTSVTPDFVRLHDDKNTFTGKACSFHYPPQITYILCVTH